METGTHPQAAFEVDGHSSLYGQSSALIAMVACNLVLLLMLAA